MIPGKMRMGEVYADVYGSITFATFGVTPVRRGTYLRWLDRLSIISNYYVQKLEIIRTTKGNTMSESYPDPKQFSFGGSASKPHRSGSSRSTQPKMPTGGSPFSLINIVPIILCLGVMAVVYLIFREVKKTKLENIQMMQNMKNYENKLVQYESKLEDIGGFSQVRQEELTHLEPVITEIESSDSDDEVVEVKKKRKKVVIEA